MIKDSVTEPLVRVYIVQLYMAVFLSGKSQPIVTLQFWGIRLSHKCQVPTEYEKIKDSVLPRKMQEEHLSVPPLFQH